MFMGILGRCRRLGIICGDSPEGIFMWAARERPGQLLELLLEPWMEFWELQESPSLPSWIIQKDVGCMAELASLGYPNMESNIEYLVTFGCVPPRLGI